MSQTPDNILYIPIQINGGTKVPNDLLDRELFIKNGELYVGNGSGGGTMIIGRVVDGATITNPTINGSLTLGDGMVVSATEFNANKSKYAQPGRIIFVDESK